MLSILLIILGTILLAVPHLFVGQGVVGDVSLGLGALLFVLPLLVMAIVGNAIRKHRD